MYNNPYFTGYNPQLSPQQRLNMLEQQYSQYPQQLMNMQQVQQTPTNLGLKGRVVTSFEEARAAMIDFDGSVFFFPDISNKKIYTKQINLDGTATLQTYILLQEPVPTQANSNLQNISTNNNQSDIQRLQAEIDNLKNELAVLKGGIFNVQPNADDTDVQPVKKQSKSNGTNATNVGK